LTDDGPDQEYRSLLGQVHLIAGGYVTGFLTDTRQAAVGIAEQVPRRNELRALGTGAAPVSSSKARLKVS
jgi:hypothetical protein